MSAFVILCLVVSGCVTRQVARQQALTQYNKGLRVGRVIGRDEILYGLKDVSCFKQSINELMAPTKYDQEPAK